MRRLLTGAATVVALAGGSLAAMVTPAAHAVGAPASWSSVAPTPRPPSGTGSSLVFDPATGQLLAYDTADDQNCTVPPSQVWTWNGAAWTVRHQTAPPQGRAAAAFGYDPASRQVVMFGGIASADCPGQTFTGMEDETWTWNGSLWMQ